MSRTRRTLLCLLTSWLTLAASGDDFNLLRVVCPGAFTEVARGSLPLDDENTDFDLRGEDQTHTLVSQDDSAFHPLGFAAVNLSEPEDRRDHCEPPLDWACRKPSAPRPAWAHFLSDTPRLPSAAFPTPLRC